MSSEETQSVIYHDDYDAAAYQETLKMSSGLRETVKAASKLLPMAAGLIADLFYSFYRPSPRLIEEHELPPSGRVVRSILSEIMDTSQWDSVRQAGTLGDQL